MARTLISASKELNKKEHYLMMNNQKAMKMKDAVGMVLEVSVWAKFVDVNADGVEHTVLSIHTVDGDYYVTNSATFINVFEKIVEIFNDELPRIEVFSGTSKSGREFLNCTIADE